MSLDVLTQLILEYRYWILIPLSFIEGPIVAFIAGTLAALGYFNVYLLALLFFLRDVGGDGLYYAIGYFGGHRPFTHRALRRIGVTESHMERVRAFWLKRPGVTMFFGKLAYGIAAAFIVAAGIMKMPLRIFIFYGALIAILQYGTLLVLGYFLGASFGGTAEKILANVHSVALFAALAIAAYFVIGWRMRERFFKEEESIKASIEKGIDGR